MPLKKMNYKIRKALTTVRSPENCQTLITVLAFSRQYTE